MTFDVADIRTEVLSAFGSGFHAHSYGNGFLVVMPLVFDDGENVVLAIEEVADNAFVVTDRGQVASRLAEHGVYLDKAPGASWDAIRRASSAPVAIGTSEYELAGSATRSNLGDVTLAIAQDAIQAEGLKVLSPASRGVNLGDRVIRSAYQHELVVQPKARLKMRKGGQREVTCRIDVDAGVYIQAVGGKQRNSAYDRVRAVFGDAEHSEWKLTAVLSKHLRLDRWQIENLRELADTVIEEAEQDDYFRELSGGVARTPGTSDKEVPLIPNF